VREGGACRDTLGEREDIRCIDGCRARSRAIRHIRHGGEWTILEKIEQMQTRRKKRQSIESNLGMYVKDAMEKTPSGAAVAGEMIRCLGRSPKVDYRAGGPRFITCQRSRVRGWRDRWCRRKACLTCPFPPSWDYRVGPYRRDGNRRDEANASEGSDFASNTFR